VISLFHLAVDWAKERERERESEREKEREKRRKNKELSHVITCPGLDVECHMHFCLYKRNIMTPVRDDRSPRATRVYTGTNLRP